MEKLKKGKYYIGDPCYIFGDSWVEVLNQTDYFNDGEIVKAFGKDCIAGGTSYGDGIYKDNHKRKYWVDAGLMGCLPISLINKDKKYTKKNIEESEGMHIIDFKEDFEVSISSGIFKFGNIIIKTN
jgi:hypothetical protein